MSKTLYKKKSELSAREEEQTQDRPQKLIGIAGIVNNVVSEHHSDKRMLIQNLLDLQAKFGWLPREMLSEIATQLDVPISKVYQAATFYKALSLSPRGTHVIRVCMGTSCKVRGAPLVLDRIQRLLGIEAGETSSDGKFSLETVNCVGCCALGPTITIDNNYYGNLKVTSIKNILTKYQ
jgi:NADH-quinone oxidoreductase subunit E